MSSWRSQPRASGWSRRDLRALPVAARERDLDPALVGQPVAGSRAAAGSSRPSRPGPRCTSSRRAPPATTARTRGREPGDEDRDGPPAPASTACPTARTAAPGPPNRAPRRTALPPIGVSSGERQRRAEPVERGAPAQRRLLAREHDQAGDREQRDRQVGGGRERRPAALGERPRQEHRRQERRRGDRDPLERFARSRRSASAYATPAIARNRPATGLPSGHSTASTIASQ